MASFDYKCKHCGTLTTQTFAAGTAPSLIEISCENCSARAQAAGRPAGSIVTDHRRVFSVPGVVFRGGGWGGRPERRPPANTITLEEGKAMGYRGEEPW